ncbi:PREDICTED: tenascin-like [Dufourea novaeangliae]|uniref:EB domain-containing protein n=1 Tax=Dufourea novaeangliae TaxID=178035 RepID=A0A154PNC4_DUFNO|nr:PREDICTED: tenascin-like [Dufourea novaeangliae]KZC13349.1 hypothetical protein WN55_05947 [Dufourea novaeangliae]
MLVNVGTKRCNTMGFFLAVELLAILGLATAEQIDVTIPCETSEDCVKFSVLLKDPFCRNGHCECKYGTEYRNCSNAGILRPNSRNAGSPIFHSCKLDKECTFNNSMCNTSISQCDCQKDYVMSTTRKTCLKRVNAIESPCVEDRQCTDFLANTTCQNGRCDCIPGYHYAGNACYETIALGERCSRPEECSKVQGAVCIEEKMICDCFEETVIDSTGKRCLPVAREFLNKCVEDKQCSQSFGDAAACIDGTCRCLDRHHFELEMNRCYLDTGLDEQCGNAYDCYQADDENRTRKAVTCTANVCVCAEDFHREDDACVVNEGTRFLGSLLTLLLATFLFVGPFEEI